jgi:uncharacterized protein YkwD
MAESSNSSMLRHLRLPTALGTALALALLAVGPFTSGATSDPGLERDLLALTNVDRTSNGLPALGADARLISVARERSDDMQSRNYFSHDIPPDGRKVYDLLDARSVDFEMAGENIAFNSAGRAATVQNAEQSFMNSPTHRANILRPDFSWIGIGATPGSDKTMYTVVFMKPFSTDIASPVNVDDLGALAMDSENQGTLESVVDGVLGRNFGLD